MHDNLCPHVKRILDRALSGDLPDLDGMVFMNSCDSMRRLADAWQHARPKSRMVHLDLPISNEELALLFFKDELKRLGETLSQWSQKDISSESIFKSTAAYNKLSEKLEALFYGQKSAINAEALQEVYNFASTHSVGDAISEIDSVQKDEPVSNSDDVPIFLFGNVLPDPEAFALFESCGAKIISDDLCTGSRMFNKVDMDQNKDPYLQLAKALLSRPPCARTFSPAAPGKGILDIFEKVKNSKAKGAICYTMKFCDPYLDRLPKLREVFKEANIPFLVLEGDCTLGSIGQQRTRIEAFVEMLRS